MQRVKVSRALQKPKLLRAWSTSRDNTPRAGRPGIDGVTALQFATRLDANITTLAKSIREGQYGPSPLKGVPIPKAYSTEKRLICIPTIRDRIVQRAVVHYLVSGSKLPIYNSSSYGFIKGRGTAAAILRALELRGRFGWCVKTDIESFFDRVPRGDLKARVDRALPHNSLTPLINKFIDCEIKEERNLRSVLSARGIKRGVGLRQGMPLSPILANLVLSTFDSDVEQVHIEMVRYADDIILFFSTKERARDGLNFIKERLASQGLSIPELSDHSKTRIFGPREAIDFLGLELYFVTSEQRYVSQISRRQIAKIRQQLEDNFNLETRIKEESNFQDTVVELSRSISAYLGIYKNAYNFTAFDSELRATIRSILEGIYKDIFGKSVLDHVSERGRNFLGIGTLTMPEPLNDLDHSDME
jgi:group II intron reverse transcriptase/maturase